MFKRVIEKTVIGAVERCTEKNCKKIIITFLISKIKVFFLNVNTGNVPLL